MTCEPRVCILSRSSFDFFYRDVLTMLGGIDLSDMKLSDMGMRVIDILIEVVQDETVRYCT